MNNPCLQLINERFLEEKRQTGSMFFVPFFLGSKGRKIWIREIHRTSPSAKEILEVRGKLRIHYKRAY